MEKEKEGMVSIQFWLHESLKAKLEKYCRGRGLTMAEALRCLILNLEEGPRPPATPGAAQAAGTEEETEQQAP